MHRLRLNRIFKKAVKNGPLDCVIAGFEFNATESVEAPKLAKREKVTDESIQPLINRLQKNSKHIQRWAKRNGIDCYRIYDADLPEFAFALDVYQSDITPSISWYHLQEYQAPKTIDAEVAEKRIELAKEAVQHTFGIEESLLFCKTRQRQRGKKQYQKQDHQGELFQVREGDATLLVNLSDYLDSGLFLDHRSTRERVKQMSAGKSLLNLFCYTGSVGVQAMLGGADTVVNVDMSSNYLNWAQENHAINGFESDERLAFIRANILELLQAPARFDIEQDFDIIFLDPPSFSNSSKMQESFDIQRDHEALIIDTMKLLNEQGVLIFSTNRRGFKLSDICRRVWRLPILAVIPFPRILNAGRKFINVGRFATVPDDLDNYLSIFLNDVPLMDVRAPVEFEKGAFPAATNLPLLDDHQRQAIGIRYKKAGEQEAIQLGLKLATPEIRQQRLAAWLDFCHENRDGYLYCFRGGLRSRTTQQWIREQGINYPLIQGGYKAMRRFLIDQLEISSDQLPLVIVSGLTGSGKTRVLKQISRHIDFEGIANHRGSAFGRDVLDQQPGSINWENQTSIEFLKLRHHSPGCPVFVEDEGRRIGRVSIPDNLYTVMQQAPRAILNVEIESRIRLITEDYISSTWPDYQMNFKDMAETRFSEFVLVNLARIQKRLGGDRYQLVKQCFESALREFFASGNVEPFYDGIRILLEQYYDPMYQYQLESKKPTILFEGPQQEYLEWAEHYLKHY